jgi:hypothetical protein
MPENNKKKKILIAAGLLALVLLVAWWWQSARGPIRFGEDTPEAINEDLESVDIGDLNTEFEAIDQELNQL